jgi:hypothetical protein
MKTGGAPLGGVRTGVVGMIGLTGAFGAPVWAGAWTGDFGAPALTGAALTGAFGTRAGADGTTAVPRVR